MNVHIMLLSAEQPFFKDESKVHKGTMAIGGKNYFY